MDSRALTPAAFVLALVCFLMPFVSISCQGQQLTSITGIQAMTGTSVKEPGGFGGSSTRPIARDLVAILAFVAGLAGLVAALARHRTMAGAAGVAGAVLLFVFKSRAESQIATEGQGMLSAQFGAGYWGALLLFAAAAALSFTRLSAPAPVASP